MHSLMDAASTIFEHVNAEQARMQVPRLVCRPPYGCREMHLPSAPEAERIQGTVNACICMQVGMWAHRRAGVHAHGHAGG